MNDLQLQRVARNEALFRDANERIRQGVDALVDRGTVDRYALLCECAASSCQAMVELEREQYRHVRSDPTWFLVRPGHVVEDAEQVIEQHAGFWIVEKIGVGRRVARELASE